MSYVNAGKPARTPSPYYIAGTENYVKELVSSLQNSVDLTGRHIYMDRLCASILIAKWPLEQKITLVGTKHMRRVGIPEEIKKTWGREPFSTKSFLGEEQT